MRFWDAFGHHVRPSNLDGELAGFRRVGGQVLEVLDQLKTSAVPTAHAYIQVARCLELFADQLVEPYMAIGSDAPALPGWVERQALQIYRPIPVLVTAAKQEAIDPNGPRDVELPWILGGRVFGVEREGTPILETYVGAVKAVMDHVEVFLSEVGDPKKARLYWAEATTNYDSARYLMQDNQAMTLTNRVALDDYLWTALGYAIGAVQEGCSPGILHDLDIDTMLESRENPHRGRERGQESLGTPLKKDLLYRI
ncbi:hypothetical protein [Sulfobacillus harzensis]|uniref:Uncharacterized protein n=1 Tax=Sulfobacillus harzensis TaxID=2729629 RepID=A0A7Y0Q3K5_9FIRM|nr:hypothetical protein [Sulfobacillus harzensis]NMP24363.1 hypothetical protein [Sulfobacillus harzensis]